jgi:cytochrome oxidase assembly protein ShyY1
MASLLLRPRCRSALPLLRSLRRHASGVAEAAKATDKGVYFFSALVRSHRDIPPHCRQALTHSPSLPPSSQSLFTAGLGCWQAARYTWKVDVLEGRRRALDSDPVDISAGPLPPSLGELRRVLVRGALDDAAAVTIGPRPPPKSLPPALASAANAGFLTVQPLRREDGTKLLVLRGWTPADAAGAGAAGALAAPARNPVTITGVLRTSEQPGIFGATQEQSAAATTTDAPAAAALASSSSSSSPSTTRLRRSDFLYIDVPALASACGLSADKGDQIVLVEAVEPPAQAGAAAPASPDGPFPFPRPAASLYETFVMPSTHLIYSGTWFTLAALGAVITRARFRGGRSGGGRRGR